MSAYQYGVIAGILVGLLVGVVTWKLSRIKQHGKCRYDERQIAGQGKAYKAGFFTLLIAHAICFLGNFAQLTPGISFLWQVGATLLGVGVFAVTAIHFDAYLRINEKPSRYYIMGGCFFVAMICSGVGNITSDSPDRVNIAVIDLMVAALWLVIVAALIIHQARKKETEEE